MNKFIPVIGLEVHIELGTKSKMFCGCDADHFAKEPNTQVCPVCLGLPGALPYANFSAIEQTVMFGLSMNCRVNLFSKFDRKHYFYPDLPKGYQISQYDLPFCTKGKFQIPNSKYQIRIRRIHLEEDTAKLVHQFGDSKEKGISLVDFNRSGVPLVEMVTEPDFSDVDSVISFLRETQLLVRYLGISSADMEKGSMRLEANISLAKAQETKLQSEDLPSYKVELKNINSFRFLRKALNAEIKRQEKILRKGGKVTQETRGYDEDKNITFSQRIKEEAMDYRYFPEPDIPPISFSKSQIEDIKSKIPELPTAKRKRLEERYGISKEYIEILVQDKRRCDYFEKSCEISKNNEFSPKFIASALINQNLDKKFESPYEFVRYLKKISKKNYSSLVEIEGAIQKVLSDNSKAVKDYHEGNSNVIGFLIGQVQKILKGKGEPKLIRETLIKALQKD